MHKPWVPISNLVERTHHLNYKKVHAYLDAWRDGIAPLHKISMHEGEIVAPSTGEYVYAAHKFGVCFLQVEEV